MIPLPDGPTARPKVTQPRSRSGSAWKPAKYKLNGYATFYDYGTTAMRLPRGTVVRICGDGGCIQRTVTDYGPQKKSRIVEAGVAPSTSRRNVRPTKGAVARRSWGVIAWAETSAGATKKPNASAPTRSASPTGERSTFERASMDVPPLHDPSPDAGRLPCAEVRMDAAPRG